MEIPKGLEDILNKQFKIIGYDEITFKDFTEEGTLEVKKKEKYWYEVFQFKDYNQYLEWKNEAKPIIEKKGHKFDEIDMIYGLNYKMKKEGF